MGNVVNIDPVIRGSEWVVESLIDKAADGSYVMGLSFPQEGSEDSAHVFAPDDVSLNNLLLARAILDEIIHDLMKSGRKG